MGTWVLGVPEQCPEEMAHDFHLKQGLFADTPSVAMGKIACKIEHRVARGDR